jgi:Cu-processing system permease protein
MKKITRYVITDILRNRIMLAYTAFLLLISFSVFTLEDTGEKGLLSLLNITLIIVPLVSIIFSTIYIYNSAEFIELLLSQPLKRKTIWLSLFYGLSTSLSISFFIGAGIPIILYQPTAAGFMMLIAGIILSIVFSAIALFGAVLIRDKAKGIGISVLLWLYFSLLFDGIVLFILFQFEDYPLDKFMIGISAFNPIDLCRIFILLQMDASALMGYTGALFKNFFGSGMGSAIAAIILLLWIFIPAWLSVRKFERKDL